MIVVVVMVILIIPVLNFHLTFVPFPVPVTGFRSNKGVLTILNPFCLLC